MTDPVFTAIRDSVRDVLPDVDADRIRPDISLVELGANSLDRMDIVVDVMRRLGVKISSEELATVRDIGGLAELLRTKT
ncbi:phosphopantetheine-binding protein [Nocardia panacis]|uniref:Phosphopantetheine-binding protein n=1 Tax=Nocardia panacis TaxID=2340916 RepID=A0A3A4KBB9_9NOCA|nr:phosphopantetheine-binding protein [Nocardia panacis]RJO70740.1 phosphopantetheine-binding protein [Nocardia panacis]